MIRFVLMDVWNKVWAVTTSIESADAAARLLDPPGAFIWVDGLAEEFIKTYRPRKNVIIENFL